MTNAFKSPIFMLCMADHKYHELPSVKFQPWEKLWLNTYHILIFCNFLKKERGFPAKLYHHQQEKRANGGDLCNYSKQDPRNGSRRPSPYWRSLGWRTGSNPWRRAEVPWRTLQSKQREWLEMRKSWSKTRKYKYRLCHDLVISCITEELC